MKRLLSIWLPNWPIQRLRNRGLNQFIAAEPESEPEAGRDAFAEGGDPSEVQPRDAAHHKWPPTVLWREDPRRGRIVAARCRSAAAMGIRFGMPVVEASELLASVSARQPKKQRHNRDRPTAVSSSTADSQESETPLIAFHDERLDREALHHVARQVQAAITPLVAIEPLEIKAWAGKSLHQPDLLLGEITGVAHLFEGEWGLLRATQQLFDQMNLSARLAIADTAGTAWAVSRYQHQLPPGTIQSARASPSTDNFQPAVVVPIGETAEWLDPLPVAALRIDVNTVSTLRRLGVDTVGSLRRLPREGLAMRLGDQLVTRIAQALGEVDEPLAFDHPAAAHVHRLNLEYATNDPAILKDRIGLLIDRACQQLSESQRGALRVECQLEFASHSPCVIQIGLFAPSKDAEHLARLLLTAFESKQLPAEVVRLQLRIPLTGTIRRTQKWMFPDAEDDDERFDGSREINIARLVDTLSGRLGREAVRGVQLRDNPLPEEAYVSYPLTGRPLKSRAKRSRRRSSRREPRSRENAVNQQRAGVAPSPKDALRRPLSLLEHPVPLKIVEPGQPTNKPTVREQADRPASSEITRCPRRARIGGKVYRIVANTGPERIETGWWQGPSIRRDYFRVQTDRGEAWWIYCDLTSTGQQQWMLHGFFA